MSEPENPQRLTLRTLSRLGRDSLSVGNAASTVGLPPMFVAAPIARELNKTEVGDYDIQLVPAIKPLVPAIKLGSPIREAAKRALVGFRTSDRLQHDREDVVANQIKNTGWTGIFERMYHPTLNDLGPGKIQLGTAMDIVRRYGSDPRYVDLGLGKYIGHNDQLARDMQDPATANRLAYALQAFVAKDAVDFFAHKLGLGDSEAGLNEWNKLPRQAQTALVTAYSAMGTATLEQRANDQINRKGFYAPDAVNSDGAAYLNYDNNFDNLRSALDQQAANDTSDPARIARKNVRYVSGLWSQPR